MVSVIIPTFNRAGLIEKCVDSILSQTYKDIEVIIVDDGSTDNTREVVERMKDPRIYYYYQDNKGACAARNHGIEVSQGEYIAFQDSDDEWSPNKIERQMDALLGNNGIDIVCCKTLCRRLDGSTFESMRDVGDGFITKERGPGGITTQTLLMKRYVAENVKFDTNVTRYQDLDFLLMAQEKGYHIYCVGENLVIREIGVDSITNHPERILDMSWYFEKKHSEIMGRKGNYLSHFFSGNLMQAGQEIYENKGDYRDYFKRALQLEDSIKSRIKYIMIRAKLYPIYRRLVEIAIR